MGKKPNDLPAEFDGPTIRKVIENLIKRLLNIDADLKKEVSSSLLGLLAEQIALRKQLNIEILEQKGVTNKVDNLARHNSSRLDSVEKITISGLELLKQQIDVLNTNIKNLKSSKSLNLVSNSLGNKEVQIEKETPQELESLHRMVDDLKTTVTNLKSQTDGNSIKFGGLEFTS